MKRFPSLRLFAALLILFGVSAGGGAAQEDRPQMDAVLIQLVDDLETARLAERLETAALRLPDDRRVFIGPVPVDIADPAEPRVGVLIEFADPAAPAAIESLGGRVRTIVDGRIATARVPIDRVRELEAIPGLRRVEAAYRAELQNDIAMQDIRADEARFFLDGEWRGFAGAGVVVGIYDTGIDLTHPDFQRADGTTRILHLWDQASGAGPPPAEFAYGTYCDAARIDAGDCPHQDRNGHGTHVAGSAAGNGRFFQDRRFAGTAPAADLIIAGGHERGFPTDQIIEGIDWIFRRAAAEGRPAVINLSLGGHFGPHDGTTLHELAIDALSGPGRIVVTSAGNSGANENMSPRQRQNRIHGMIDPVTTEVRSLTFEVPAYTPEGRCDENGLTADSWYDSGDRLTVAVRRPDGSRVTAGPGQTAEEAGAQGRVRIFNGTERNAETGDFRVLIVIDACGDAGHPAPGEWAIEVRAEAEPSGVPYHLWILFAQFGDQGGARTGDGFTNSHNVSVPATARQAITVAAHVTRLCWPAVDGERCWRSQFGWAEEVGDIAYFSSVGPTRDGRLKPDLSAPGRMVVSARSSAAQFSDFFVHPSRGYVAFQGTSMASPITAGATALMLEADAQLDPTEARTLLQASARTDAFTRRSYATGDPGNGSNPNWQWGHGKLDALGALEAMGVIGDRPRLTVEVEATAPTDPVRLPASRVRMMTLRLTARAPDEAEAPEPVVVRQLGFELRGEAPQGVARLLENDTPLAEQPFRLAEAAADTVVFPLGLEIPPGETRTVTLAVEPGAGTPHGSDLRALFLPALTLAAGAETGGAVVLEQPEDPPVSRIEITLLDPEEAVTMSANPVRGESVVFNFRSPPARAAIYTVSGRRVLDFTGQLEGAVRYEWDLTNDQGRAVAPGVYLVVFEIDGGVQRRRLVVIREQ